MISSSLMYKPKQIKKKLLTKSSTRPGSVKIHNQKYHIYHKWSSIKIYQYRQQENKIFTNMDYMTNGHCLDKIRDTGGLTS